MHTRHRRQICRHLGSSMPRFTLAALQGNLWTANPETVRRQAPVRQQRFLSNSNYSVRRDRSENTWQGAVTRQAQTSPPIIIASDAQVAPGEPPSGGYLCVDMATNARWGAWTIFGEKELNVLGTSDQEIQSGRQPISRLECAMLPLVFATEREKIAGRDVWYFVDNTSSLCAMGERN